MALRCIGVAPADSTHTHSGKDPESIEKKGTGTHPIDDKQLAADILARAARKKHDGPGKVLRLAPSARRDTLGDLAQAVRICEELFVPGRSRKQKQVQQKKRDNSGT